MRTWFICAGLLVAFGVIGVLVAQKMLEEMVFDSDQVQKSDSEICGRKSIEGLKDDNMLSAFFIRIFHVSVVSIYIGTVLFIVCYALWVNIKIKGYDSEKISGLKKYSVIAYGIERFFRSLQFMPFQCFISNRPDIQRLDSFVDPSKRENTTKTRSHRVDLYIFIWFMVELMAVVTLCLVGWRPTYLILVVRILGALRIIDIIQVNVNIVLFDRLRIEKDYYMASLVRTIVLTMLNYFQMLVWFGLIYCTILNDLKNANDWTDAFYFSIITQLTIGYGDIAPLRSAKLIAVGQGIIGFFFMVLILARFITILPKVKTLLGDEEA